jgi:hypothetical protein
MIKISRNVPQICIGLASKAGDVHQFGRMLCDALSEIGLVPLEVEDGSPVVLQSDALLLIGGCHSFDGFAQLLDNIRRSRPKTILWQIDPLPPKTLTPEAERIGEEAWQKLERHTRSLGYKAINACLTRPMRQKRKQAVYENLFRDFKDQMARTLTPPFNNLDEDSCKFIMRGYLLLRRNAARGWLDHIFCTIPARQQFLQSRGISAHYAPLGYHPIMGRRLNCQRDIDALFIGNTTDCRRRSIMEDLRKNLYSKRITLHSAERGCFGDERTALLNRAAISLNVPKVPWEVAGLRFLMSMACGAMVISEQIEDPTPYTPGVHFVQVGLSDIPDAIEYYLNNREERNRIVDAAYNYITRELTMENSIMKILREVGIPHNTPH